MRPPNPTPPTGQYGHLSLCTTLVLTCLLLAGCAERKDLPRAPVSGTVFCGEQMLDSGTIRFVPTGETEGPIVTADILDGQFWLPPEQGPVVGMHRVEIVPRDFLGFDPGDQEAAERAMQQGKRPPRSPVPPIYQRRTSPLMAEIHLQELNILDFTIATGSSNS